METFYPQKSGGTVSGGAWNYREFELEEQAETVRKLLLAVAKTEHIVDWAVSLDTSKEDAAKELFALWESTFNEIYDA